MRHVLPAISIVILIILCLFGMLLWWMKYFDYEQRESKIASFWEYYSGLARGCYQKNSVNCCLSSVSTMQEKKAYLIGETGCGRDTKQDTLKCVDSYTWCETTDDLSLHTSIKN